MHLLGQAESRKVPWAKTGVFPTLHVCGDSYNIMSAAVAGWDGYYPKKGPTYIPGSV